jgi:hypothetical protein
MTQQEYKDQLNMLRQVFETDKKVLAKKYAFANNKVEVGDIVSDLGGSIKVESVKVSINQEYPCCVYQGVLLKKDGTPNKRGDLYTVWQTSMTNHIPKKAATPQQ